MERYINSYRLFFIMLLFAPGGVYAQQLSSRLILTDSGDSLLLKAYDIRFDKEGHYYFQIEKNGGKYLYTDHDTLGPFKGLGSISGTHGELKYTYANTDEDDSPWYFKNGAGTHIYGPVRGHEDEYSDGGTEDHMAITSFYKDSIYYYIDNKLISREKRIENTAGRRDWCAMSQNGHKIYSAAERGRFNLYVDDSLIATSDEDFLNMEISDDGRYIYGRGHAQDPKIKGYDYSFSVHTRDTAFGPVRTVWDYGLRPNGGYYYSGDDNGTYYIIIDNALYKHIQSIANITIIDSAQYLFTYRDHGQQKINVSGNSYALGSEKIPLTAMDINGHAACLLMRDYYLYKWVDGYMGPDPVSRYGVRPTPLYISPQGRLLCYFRTDDSIYVYQDDELLLPAVSRSSHFEIIPYEDMFPFHMGSGQKKMSSGKGLIYMEVDSTGYFVYNGELSRPMYHVLKNSYEHLKQTGEIVAGNFYKNDFYVIQKTGEGTFTININNKVYETIHDVQDILQESCYLDEKGFVFYAIKGHSFYRYKLTL